MLHGVVLCHENILVVGIPAQSLQPIVVAFIHKGDGPTIHALEKTLQLLFQEKQKLVVPPTILALVDYHKPKHPSLILEMVNAYKMKGWYVGMYGMGLVVEFVLKMGFMYSFLTPNTILNTSTPTLAR